MQAEKKKQFKLEHKHLREEDNNNTIYCETQSRQNVDMFPDHHPIPSKSNTETPQILQN